MNDTTDNGWRFEVLRVCHPELFDRLVHDPDQVCGWPIPEVLRGRVREVDRGRGWQLNRDHQHWLQANHHA
ncbi:MAG TPA: hypothetical protein VIJ15_16070 [Dermatophilaceae bacterium]